MFKVASISQLLASSCLGIFRGYNNSQSETSILSKINDIINKILSNTLTLIFVYSESKENMIFSFKYQWKTNEYNR